MPNGDNRYSRQTLKGIGSDMDSRLVAGAYLAAKADAPDYGWLNLIGTGVKAYKTEYDAKKALEKTERDAAFNGIEETINTIYERGGSLDQEYFDQAFDYTEKLREEYAAAVANDDTKAQHQIKGKLNAFSSSIQGVKGSLTEAAELWNDDMLTNRDGFTTEQISINASIKGGNAVLTEDGSFKWKALDINGDPMFDEDGEQKYYTIEDLKKALPMRDEVSKEEYLSTNKTIVDAGENYRNGEGSDFDIKTNFDKNMKLMTDENLQSWIWDDQTGQGSFAESLEEHPDFQSIFNAMNKGEDGLQNTLMIGMYDKTSDGVVDFRDFIEHGTPESEIFYSQRFDKNQDGKISDEELKIIMNDPNALRAIQDVTKGKLKDALTKTDHENFNADVSKRLVADFLTNRQKQMFYGGNNEYKLLVPNSPGSKVIFRNNRLYIGSFKKENRITSLKQYRELGGNYGHLKSLGYVWNNDTKRFTYTEPSDWSNPLSSVESR